GEDGVVQGEAEPYAAQLRGDGEFLEGEVVTRGARGTPGQRRAPEPVGEAVHLVAAQREGEDEAGPPAVGEHARGDAPRQRVRLAPRRAGEAPSAHVGDRREITRQVRGRDEPDLGARPPGRTGRS